MMQAEVRRGSLYLTAEICARWLAGLDCVALLRDGDDLVVLPVRHAAAGGFLMKRRNGAGDRVVHAPEFFRANGIGDDAERTVILAWDERRAALVATRGFAY